MNETMTLLQSTRNELGESNQSESFYSQAATATSWYLSKKPAQMQPNVQQKETQPNQQETIGWISGRGPATYTSRAAVAGLNAEAAAVRLPCLLGRPVEVNQDEDQPSGPTLHPSCAVGRGKCPTHGKLSRERCRVVLERIRCSIALVSTAI